MKRIITAAIGICVPMLVLGCAGEVRVGMGDESVALGAEAPSPLFDIGEGESSCLELALKLDETNLQAAERTAEDIVQDGNTTTYVGAGAEIGDHGGPFESFHPRRTVTPTGFHWRAAITHCEIFVSGSNALIRAWGLGGPTPACPIIVCSDF